MVHHIIECPMVDALQYDVIVSIQFMCSYFHGKFTSIHLPLLKFHYKIVSRAK